MTNEDFERWENEGGGPVLGDTRLVRLTEDELDLILVALDEQPDYASHLLYIRLGRIQSRGSD